MAFSTSLLLLFAGLLLIIVDIPANLQMDKNHELLYLGLFAISIAGGYAVYDKEQEDEKLMDVYQQADVRMYENKKQIKSVQPKPAEFYANRI